MTVTNVLKLTLLGCVIIYWLIIKWCDLKMYARFKKGVHSTHHNTRHNMKPAHSSEKQLKNKLSIKRIFLHNLGHILSILDNLLPNTCFIHFIEHNVI